MNKHSIDERLSPRVTHAFVDAVRREARSVVSVLARKFGVSVDMTPTGFAISGPSMPDGFEDALHRVLRNRYGRASVPHRGETRYETADTEIRVVRGSSRVLFDVRIEAVGGMPPLHTVGFGGIRLRAEQTMQRTGTPEALRAALHEAGFGGGRFDSVADAYVRLRDVCGPNTPVIFPGRASFDTPAGRVVVETVWDGGAVRVTAGVDAPSRVSTPIYHPRIAAALMNGPLIESPGSAATILRLCEDAGVLFIGPGADLTEREAPRVGSARDVIAKVAPILRSWRRALPGIDVVLGGSLVSGTFVFDGAETVDVDVRFLADEPSSGLAQRVAAATGLSVRKTIQVNDWPDGTSTAWQIEGILNVPGLPPLDIEGSLRNRAYVGWASMYRKVLTPDELSTFVNAKQEMRGDKAAYKALKQDMLRKVRDRAVARGLVREFYIEGGTLVERGIPGSMRVADLLKRLAKAGWELVRQRGSHRILQKLGQTIVVAFHDGVEIGRKMLSRIAKQVGPGVLEAKITESLVAQTILQQLGGSRFRAMTGMHSAVAHPKGFSFKIGRNAKGVNYVMIELDPSDTYTITTYSIRKYEPKEKERMTGVYADNLRSVFTKMTGLYTSL